MKSLKKLVGFPIGEMMLIGSYIAVYLSRGKDVYQSYLSQLNDANVLLNQAICAGVFYTVFVIFIRKLVDFLNNQDRADNKGAVKAIVWFILASLIGIGIDKFASFKGEEVVDILIGSAYILLMLGYIVYLIRNMINVHKINKTLENRNK